MADEQGGTKAQVPGAAEGRQVQRSLQAMRAAAFVRPPKQAVLSQGSAAGRQLPWLLGGGSHLRGDEGLDDAMVGGQQVAVAVGGVRTLIQHQAAGGHCRGRGHCVGSTRPTRFSLPACRVADRATCHIPEPADTRNHKATPLPSSLQGGPPQARRWAAPKEGVWCGVVALCTGWAEPNPDLGGLSYS